MRLPLAWRATVLELLDDVATAEHRMGELHMALVKVTRETPYPEELDECRSARAALIAEIGTLRAKVVGLQRDLDRARGLLESK